MLRKLSPMPAVRCSNRAKINVALIDRLEIRYGDTPPKGADPRQA